MSWYLQYLGFCFHFQLSRSLLKTSGVKRHVCQKQGYDEQNSRLKNIYKNSRANLERVEGEGGQEIASCSLVKIDGWVCGCVCVCACVCVCTHACSRHVHIFLSPVRGRGRPTECRHLTKSPSPNVGSTLPPILVITRMLATT